MENYVSMELFNERTQHIQESISELRSDIHQLSEALKVVPELRQKVAEHEEFLAKLKKWGLRALIFLAGGGTVGAITLPDILKWMGL